MKLLEPKSMININDQVGGSTTEEAMINVEGDDRLSRLPDDLIHKILSCVSIHDAIETSFLSSRWRYIWTSIPYLNFSDKNYFRQYGFSNFVLNVLSRLNHQMQVSSVNFVDRTLVTHDFVERIVKYAVSHHVQQLTLTCDLYTVKLFPLSVFSSKSLKHLTIGGYHCTSTCNVSPTWELPALTTLHLDLITLSDEHHTTDKCIGLFSKCTNLKNLSLRRCEIKGTNVFNIFHSTLSNLTLDTFWDIQVINVVTPQLKNLTIRFCYRKHMISAPQLTSLVLEGCYPFQLSTEGFPFLEKVDLFISMQTLAVVAHKMVCLLQQLHNVKFLTLNFKLLQLLCTSTELNSRQPACAFPNLKISKFSTNDTGMVYLEVATQEEVTMIIELENHDTSPTAIFPLISCEEIEVMSKLVLARELVEKLRELLKLCDINNDHIAGCKRKRSKVQVKKQWVQSAIEMQWHFGEMMAQIEQGILDGLLKKELPTLEEIHHMISMLQCIERLMTELPTSKRPALQVTFSNICEKAAILMNIWYAEARGSPVTSFNETGTELRSLFYL